MGTEVPVGTEVPDPFWKFDVNRRKKGQKGTEVPDPFWKFGENR